MHSSDKAKMEENNIDTTIAKALKSFLCFLYVGNDRPYYDATKIWKKEDYYSEGKHLQNLEILVSDKKNELVPLDKIKLAMDSCLIRKPDTLMFALAMCARQGKSKKLTTSTYYFVTEHCKEWKYFILFIAYTAYLSRVRSSNKNENEKKNPCGSGRGWRNAVNKWYLSHDAADLAILIGRYKSAHGLKHRDILKLSHIDFLNAEVAKQVVFTYALDGLNAACRKFGNELEAKSQLDYLKRVEKLRTCQNPTTVVEILSNGDFTIDHIHPNALKDQIVWESLLPGMDVRSVLKYLPKIAQLGFLRKGSTLTEIIVRILTDRNNLSWNKVLPGEILAVLDLYDEAPTVLHLSRGRLTNVQYEESAFEGLVGYTAETRRLIQMGMEAERRANEEKEKKEQEEKERRKTGKNKKKSGVSHDKVKLEKIKKEPVKIKSPNIQVKDALQTALNLSQKVDITGSSKKYYVLAIKMPPKNDKKISCSEIGLTIALPLLHRGNAPENGTTIIFDDPAKGYGFIPEISKDWSFDEALVHTLKLSRDVQKWIPLPLGPLGFCDSEDKECDVFINVTNLPPTRPPTSEAINNKSMRSLVFCKKYSNVQQRRYVNILLNKAPFELKGTEWDEILTIRGFDTNVPFIIEAYARELF